MDSDRVHVRTVDRLRLHDVGLVEEGHGLAESVAAAYVFAQEIAVDETVPCFECPHEIRHGGVARVAVLDFLDRDEIEVAEGEHAGEVRNALGDVIVKCLQVAVAGHGAVALFDRSEPVDVERCDVDEPGFLRELVGGGCLRRNAGN